MTCSPIISRKLQTLEPVRIVANFTSKDQGDSGGPSGVPAAFDTNSLLLHCLPSFIEHKGNGRGLLTLAQKTHVTVTFTVADPDASERVPFATQVQCNSEASSLYMR